MCFVSHPIGAALLCALTLVSCLPTPDLTTDPQSPSPPPPPPVVTPSGPAPGVVAKSAIVIDAVTGRVLAAKNPDARRAVASTQKLLTALLVVEAGPLSDPVTIEHSDTTVEPTKLYLKEGHRYPRSALLKAILVRSANDASISLARDVGGSAEGFRAMMNQRARSLGMYNSHFINPHGLTEEGQYSTARDVAKLARAAYQYSSIRQPMTWKSYTFVHNDGKKSVLTNTNKLLKSFPYTTGMKTGTTRASGKCLVSSATYQGRTVIAVVLGSTPQFVWKDSEKLLRWGLRLPATAN